jgi:hypothetical protein
MSSQAIAAYAEAARLLNDEPSAENALQKLENSDIYRLFYRLLRLCLKLFEGTAITY